MNILIDLLPTEVEIGGEMYEINFDFRTSILFELLMQDAEIEDTIKYYQTLDLFFPNRIPENLMEEAIEKIIWFYGCGEEDIYSNNSTRKVKNNKRIYSFEYDGKYIYSAFLDQYGIDLQDIEGLHWWKFKAMFESLKEDNKISEIMNYRSTDLSKIPDKEEKAFYKNMQELYKLPDKIDRNEEEKLNEIAEILMGDGVLNTSNL